MNECLLKAFEDPEAMNNLIRENVELQAQLDAERKDRREVSNEAATYTNAIISRYYDVVFKVHACASGIHAAAGCDNGWDTRVCLDTLLQELIAALQAFSIVLQQLAKEDHVIIDQAVIDSGALYFNQLRQHVEAFLVNKDHDSQGALREFIKQENPRLHTLYTNAVTRRGAPLKSELDALYNVAHPLLQEYQGRTQQWRAMREHIWTQISEKPVDQLTHDEQAIYSYWKDKTDTARAQSLRDLFKTRIPSAFGE